jgi:hypothetical protein
MIGLGLHGFIHYITSLKYLKTFSSLSFWLKINYLLKLNNSNLMVKEFNSMVWLKENLEDRNLKENLGIF